MNDQTHPPLHEARAAADLTSLAVEMYTGIDGDTVAVLVLHLTALDGVEFQVNPRWALAADPDDLREMARQLLEALEGWT